MLETIPCQAEGSRRFGRQGRHVGRDELYELAAKLLDNRELRDQFRRDPRGAAEQAGIALDDEGVRIIRSAGADKLADDELVHLLRTRGLSA